MLNFGLGEILIIGIFVLLFVGPDRLPTMLRFLGRQYGKLRNANNELRRAFTIEADRAEAEARAERLKVRREEARRKHEALLAKARAQAASESNESNSLDNDPLDEPIPIAAEGIVRDRNEREEMTSTEEPQNSISTAQDVED